MIFNIYENQQKQKWREKVYRDLRILHSKTDKTSSALFEIRGYLRAIEISLSESDYKWARSTNDMIKELKL